MKYTQLGKTGIAVSAIGFGGWAIGGPVDLFGIPVGWGVVHDQESQRAIDRAWELGVNFFDTADVYGSGHSEELLGRCLQGKNAIIATKVGNARKEGRPVKDFSEAHIRAQLEASLRRLRRETIDIYHLHNPPQEVWEADEVFRLLEKLKQEGRVRAAGVSISAMEEGKHLIETRKVDLLQVLFNVLNQAPAEELIPLAEKAQIGVIARVPLASGLLTGKFQKNHQFPGDDNRQNYLTPRRLTEALERVDRLKQMVQDSGYTLQQVGLAFLLRYPVVPIPGAKNIFQVEQNISAIDVQLPEPFFRAIREHFASYNFYLRHKVRV